MIAAVIGLGSIGLRHTRNLIDMGIDVVGYDPSPSACDHAGAAGVRLARDRETAITQADVVVIASPNRYHLEDLEISIALRRHVYAEKPIAHDGTKLALLLNDADKGGLTVFAGLNLRYHPCVEQVRHRLRNGEVGEILWARFIAASYLPSWRPGKNHQTGYAADPTTGGIIFDDIHEIDLANYLLGDARVIAAAARSTGSVGIASDDCADLILQHEGGCQSSIHMDYVTRPKQRIVEIAGARGFINVDIGGRRYSVADVNDGRETFDIGGEANDDYRNAMAHFLRCTAGKGRPRCDGHQAALILDQALEARRLAGLAS